MIQQAKKEILTEISNELKNITNFRIKTNTKAYYELEKTIFQWDFKINEITNSINQNFSFIKIVLQPIHSDT